MKPLVFRVDSSTAMGTGHVMRCLALAQAWQEQGGQAVFVIGEEAEVLTPRLRAEGVEVERIGAQSGGEEDIRRTAACAHRLGAEWVVVDGYQFTGRYQRLLRETGFRLLAVDDYGHAERYEADLVLNQNLAANESLYRNRAEHTRLLLGVRFVLLRREFVKRRGWRREIPEVAHKVVVTLGGSDPDNATLKVIRALQQIPHEGLEVEILAGAANPYRAVLEAAVRGSSALQLKTNATNMPEVMKWADIAVAAGGTTCWELMFLGLPAVVGVLAANQHEVAQRLSDAQAARNLGRFDAVTPVQIAQELSSLLTDPQRRGQYSRNGQALVDGLGASRVVGHMIDRVIRLRRACADDCRQIWEWSNDPAVRAASFSTDLIPWERHVEWFRRKLDDPRHLFFVASDKADRLIGQARCDLAGAEGTLSISLAAAFRGQGYSRLLIQAVAEETFQTSTARRLHAYVKEGNVASQRAFLSCGFGKVESLEIKGAKASHFILARTER
jgi:UDP-2,4-diacetamido-2,4,6-trideoxy-beta-L-altropyranose hydrolase